MTEIIIAFVAVLAGLIAGLLIGNMKSKEIIRSNHRESEELACL